MPISLRQYQLVRKSTLKICPKFTILKSTFANLLPLKMKAYLEKSTGHAPFLVPTINRFCKSFWVGFGFDALPRGPAVPSRVQVCCCKPPGAMPSPRRNLWTPRATELPSLRSAARS